MNCFQIIWLFVFGSLAIAVTLLAGYFLGFSKGYNQRERDLERD